MRAAGLWAVSLLVLCVLVVLQVTAAPPDIEVKKELLSYTHWTKVSEHSPMDAIAAFSCAYVPQPAPNDPHAKFYITVFVNPIGLRPCRM